jgi:hypothetical protein
MILALVAPGKKQRSAAVSLRTSHNDGVTFCLHRLRRVLLWAVTADGKGCADQRRAFSARPFVDALEER